MTTGCRGRRGRGRGGLLAGGADDSDGPAQLHDAAVPPKATPAARAAMRGPPPKAPANFDDYPKAIADFLNSRPEGEQRLKGLLLSWRAIRSSTPIFVADVVGSSSWCCTGGVDQAGRERRLPLGDKEGR